MSNKLKDISDTQVLAQLRSRKLRLQLELERVDIAIRAFENIKDIDPLDAAIYELDEAESVISVQDELATAILLYNPKMTAEKKIEYALKQIGTGNTHEITEYLLRVDGHVTDVTRLFNNVTFVASRMYRAGRLGVDKVGNKNRYKLPFVV